MSAGSVPASLLLFARHCRGLSGVTSYILRRMSMASSRDSVRTMRDANVPPTFPPIIGDELLKFGTDHRSVSIVSRVFSQFQPAVTVHDLSVKEAKYLSDDEAYKRDVDLWRLVSRGNCIAGSAAADSSSSTRIVSRGVRKFFDFQPAEVPKDLKLVVSTEKANGECARIAWDHALQGWWVGSKNVTLFLRQKSDLDATPMYKDTRYTFATVIARVWMNTLEDLSAENRQRVFECFQQQFMDCTAVAELISSTEHVVYYEENERSKLRFFAAVPNDGRETCLHPQLVADLLRSVGLITVKYELVSPDDLHGHIRRVFRADFSEEGEGRVLYFLNSSEKVVHIAKAKNQTYWILRAIREAMKGIYTPKKMVDKLKKKRDFLELDDEALAFWSRVAVSFGNFARTRKGIAHNFPSYWKEFRQKNGASWDNVQKIDLNSVSDASLSDKVVLLFCGIPGCGKDTLICELAKAAGMLLARWTLDAKTQIAADMVVISQDNFGPPGKNKDSCTKAFLCALQDENIRFVFLSRNNFSKADRSAWVDMALAVTNRVYAVYPEELFSSNDLHCAATLMRSIAHVAARQDHPASLDQSMDGRKSAYIVASFFKNRQRPSLEEVNGLISYRILNTAVLHEGLQREGSETRQALKEVSDLAVQVVPFKLDDKVQFNPSTRKMVFASTKKTSGANAVGKGKQRAHIEAGASSSETPNVQEMVAFEVMEHILKWLPHCPAALDVDPATTAQHLWTQLSSMVPVPIYYGLFPDPGSDAERKLRSWVKDIVGADLHGYDDGPLMRLHVTLLYLGKQRPDPRRDAAKYEMQKQLEELCDAGAEAVLRFRRVICSNEVIVADVEVVPGASTSATIPCSNKHPHVTLAIRGTLHGSPTKPVHANELMELVYSGEHERITAPRGFHNVHILEVPSGSEPLELDCTLERIFR